MLAVDHTAMVEEKILVHKAEYSQPRDPYELNVVPLPVFHRHQLKSMKNIIRYIKILNFRI